MTKAHPHRQVNVHLDTIDDADVIERIEAQPSMVDYVRELVRRDIHGEQLDCMVLKTSELQSENAKLRELLIDAWDYINHPADASWTHTRRKEARDSLSDRMYKLGAGEDE